MRTLAVMTLLLAACGGSDSVSVDSYPAALRDALCRYLAKCGDVESLDTCRKTNIGITLHISASEQAAIDMGKTAYSGDNAGVCLDAIANRSCDLTSQASRVEPDVCQHIAAGTVHGGSACALDAECISQICDVPACNMACCQGTCVGDAAPGRAKIGQSCSTAACADGSFCDGTTLVCTALKPAGAACAFGGECGYGLACVGRMCQAVPGPGQPCTTLCRDDGTTCSPTSHTCVKAGLAGAACTPNPTVGSDCSPVYFCDATRHCSAGIALGQPCAIGQRCADDRAFCDVAAGQTAGMCALPKPDGSPCQRDAACDSLYCDPVTVHCAPEPVCI